MTRLLYIVACHMAIMLPVSCLPDCGTMVPIKTCIVEENLDNCPGGKGAGVSLLRAILKICYRLHTTDYTFLLDYFCI